MTENKELELVPTANEILGRNLVRIDNLMVSPLPRLNLAMGRIESLIDLSKNIAVKGIVWNERKICLLTDDRNTFIIFKPEVEKDAEMFFELEGKHKKGDIWIGYQSVWDGECAPVSFTKQRLLKFIKQHKALITKETEDAIKNMRITETKAQNEEMLSLDSDDHVTTIEERYVTNIPRQFTIHMPLAPNVSADLMFEAEVVEMKDDYDRKKGKGIQLRCINGRQVMKDMMENFVAQLPENIPRYYGEMMLGEPKDEY